MNNNLKQLRKNFKNPQLLDQALTHRSWINENPGIRNHNERLEFLGDAVLELVVSRHIFFLLPDKEEGYLTPLRANLVNTHNLSQIAKKLNIGEALFLSNGEETSGGRANTSLLANTMEAIIGAIYLDGGYEKAQDFITQNILSGLNEKLNKPLKDPKSILQETLQASNMPAPRYFVLEESGPDHNKTFTVEVKTNGETLAKGKGKSKSEAERVAAASALAKLNKIK